MSEDNVLNSLPPFYVGQKIVALKSSPRGEIKKGKVYTCAGCGKRKCGCWYVDILEYPANPLEIFDWDCPDCGTREYGIKGIYYQTAPANRFAPIQENFTSISYSRVMEEEGKLVSSN